MALWGRNDQSVTANASTTAESSNGAPIGTHALVKSGANSSVRVNAANAHFGNTSAGSRANVDVAMFGNTTMSAFVPGIAVGVFGVDAAEMGVITGTTNGVYRVTTSGSGYASNTAAAVTLTFANGTANTLAANSTVVLGRVTTFTSNAMITGVTGQNPTLTVTAPASISITANSQGFSNTTDTLVVTTANSKWQVGDRLYYGVPAGNTAIAPLTGNAYYYVSFTNASTIALSSTLGGANIDLVDTRVTNPGEAHSILGDTAAGTLIVSGAKRHAAHAGWVLRTEGSGGRAGRVQMETLVAMGSLGAQTAA